MISPKYLKIAVLLVVTIVLSFFWAGSVLAETPDGTGPDSAMGPGTWNSIDAGETHWFAFHVGYDGEPAEVEIQLFAEPENGATFTVRNEEQVRLWRMEGEDEWFGAGTENELVDADLFWTGAFESSGTYYVVVEHGTLSSGPTIYKLTISGEAVSFPAMDMPAAPVPAVAPVEEAAEAAPAVPMGTGPDTAMAPTAEWTSLAVGEQHWYAFDFDYDADVTEPIEIQLYAEPEESAILTVRNAEQAQLWRTEGESEHVGCCTLQDVGEDEETDYGVWSGQLFSSGRYYIVVEHAKNMMAPATYRFTIDGPNISFPSAATAPATVAAPFTQVAVAEAPMSMASLAGSGPDMPMTPTAEWSTLEAGTTHWYAFTYDFDPDYDDIEIKVYAEPENGAVVTLRNAEQAQLWRTEGENEHFGCCTPETINDEESDFGIWLGRPDSSGTYYIVVESAENVDGPILYTLTITGEGVSY